MRIFFNNTLQDQKQIISLLEKDKIYMNSLLKFQQQLRELILQNMQKLANSTDDGTSSCSDIILKFLEDLKSNLNIVKENIILIKNELQRIDNLILECTQSDANFNILNLNIDTCDVEETILKNTIHIQSFLSSILNYSKLEFTTIPKNDTPSISDENEETINKQEIKSESENKYQENTLIISELKGKVILPYKISELNKMLENNPEKYNTIEDIIEQIYTVPFSLYKNLSISRFREAFKLVHDREHKSIKSAFDLGMEMLFNYNLHPAIISACKTLDELDIYLDYLENNETDKFDLFQVIFDIAPIVVKNKSI